jgi:hypothetical protein
VSREKTLTEECLIEILVRFSFERKERFLRKFIYDFRRSPAQDEKTFFVERALKDLYSQIAVEPLWQCLSDENLEYVRKSMERSLMAQVYGYALYPNKDADISRDEYEIIQYISKSSKFQSFLQIT